MKCVICGKEKETLEYTDTCSLKCFNKQILALVLVVVIGAVFLMKILH